MEKYIDSVVSLPCSVGIVWRGTFIVWSVYLALWELCGEVH